MKRTLIFFLPILLLAGCELQSNEDFWTAEVCTQRLEGDIVNFHDYQEEFASISAQAEKDMRSGNTVNAEINTKNAQSRIDVTKSLLAFIEKDILVLCKGKVSQAILDEIEKARKFAAGSAVVKAEEEGMPSLQVSNIRSTFVPYQMDQFGRCEGPILDLVITVANNGGDYPRPVDIETYAERAQRAAPELDFFTATAEFDFGGVMKKRLDFTVKGDRGFLKKGGSLEIPTKLKIDHNQKHASVKGTITTNAFLQSSPNVPYETQIDVPIWDIYTFSHQVIQGKDSDDGKTYIAGKGTVTNLGSTPTPGPIEVSFTIRDAATGAHIESWSGKTPGPVSGNTDLYAKIPSAKKLPKKVTVDSSIGVLCPDGTSGNLADGDTTNNIRTLIQEEETPPSSLTP